MINQRDKTALDYLEIIWRRKWWLIIPTLLIFVITVSIGFKLPKVYRASTFILVEQQKIPSEYVKSLIQVSMTKLLSTIRQQIMSRTLLRKVVEEFDPYPQVQDPKPLTVLQKALDRFGVFSGWSGRPLTQDEMINKTREGINIKTIGGRGNFDGFSISFDHEDPEMAMKVTNRLAMMFIETNLQIREDMVEGTTEFLELELERLREILERQEEKVREFKHQYIGELPSQLVANLRALDRFQIELDSTKRTMKEQGDRESSLEIKIASSMRNNVPGFYVEERLINLKRRLAELQTHYKEDYPDVVLVRLEIEEIEHRLKEGDLEPVDQPAADTALLPEWTVLQSVRANLEILGEREKSLLSKIKIYEGRVERVPMREQKLMALVRDYENTKRSYGVLLNKTLNAKISENLEKRQKGQFFRVLDRANRPSKPIKPDQKMIFLIGLGAGFGVGLGLVFLREQFDTSFHNQEALESATGFVVLASIPNHELNLKVAGSTGTLYAKAGRARRGIRHERPR